MSDDFPDRRGWAQRDHTDEWYDIRTMPKLPKYALAREFIEWLKLQTSVFPIAGPATLLQLLWAYEDEINKDSKNK